MSKTKAAKAPGEQTIRALLERHACPVPFHEVRTRFLGNIATPKLSASPLQTVRDLWGGNLPAFDSLDGANELIGALIQGLWNDLTRHQKRSQPFRLARVPMEPSIGNLDQYGRVRMEELNGFIEGLFDGREAIDLPERAHEAIGRLSELQAMMFGICDLASRDPQPETATQLETTFKRLRELNRIMEAEINEAVLSCTRARRHMRAGIVTKKPTVH